MNYQIPLMNLISRGHLSVKNKIATENFIKNLDNESCGTILENLLFNVDSRDCARRLDSIMESYELQNNIRHQLRESTLNNARDKVLCEDIENNPEDLVDANSENAKEIIKLLKIGMAGGAFAMLFRMKPAERKETLETVKGFNIKAYNYLMTSPVFRKVLPEDPNTFLRTGDAIWKFSGKDLKPQDRLYLAKLKKFGKTSALVAAGITTALIAGTIAYRQLFSMEARKCNGLLGKKRTICMCNAVITAAEDAKRKSEEALLNCDQAKDPQECRYKMKVEIRSWMKKIEEQKRKLAKLESVNSKAYPTERPKPEITSPVEVGTPSDPFGVNSNPFG